MWDGLKWEKESRQKLWQEASVGLEQRLGGIGSRTPRRRPGEILQDPGTEAEETGERTLGLGQG